MKIGTHDTHLASDLFPLLEEAHLCELTDDIKANGLRHPIVRCDGRILDGRNRLLAWERAGVNPPFEEARPEDAVGYVLSTNLYRRHLSPSQAAMVAATAVPLLAPAAKGRQRAAAERTNEKLGRGMAPTPVAHLLEASDASTIGDVRGLAARLVGVSPRTVGHAMKVRRLGTPKVIAAVERGEVAVSTAARIVDRPAEEQDALLSGKPMQAPARGPRQADDGVGHLMTRLRLTWRELTPKRRRDLIQALKVFLQMHEGREYASD